MNAMILLGALSAGQPPVPPVIPVPIVAQPGAAQPAPMTPPGMPPMGAPGTGEMKEEEPKEEEKKDEPEPYALMRLLSATGLGQRMNERGVTVSGWVQGNYTLSTSNRSNLPVTFNDRKDFWQMNQNFLRIDKAIDTEKGEFQLGYRSELILPGTDSRFTISRGLLDQQLRNGQNGGAKKYPIDVFQSYVEAWMPNLGPNGTSVKVGKFATLVGYELVQGAETPFLQRSYLFQYNPFTHTGVLATSKLNDTWTASYGAALGSDNFIDSTNRFTYGLAWNPIKSLIVRPTVRYDHNNTSRPFDGSPNLFTAAFDMILRY